MIKREKVGGPVRTKKRYCEKDLTGGVDDEIMYPAELDPKEHARHRA